MKQALQRKQALATKPLELTLASARVFNKRKKQNTFKLSSAILDMGFASSMSQAYQLINHKHVTVSSIRTKRVKQAEIQAEMQVNRHNPQTNADAKTNSEAKANANVSDYQLSSPHLKVTALTLSSLPSLNLKPQDLVLVGTYCKNVNIFPNNSVNASANANVSVNGNANADATSPQVARLLDVDYTIGIIWVYA